MSLQHILLGMLRMPASGYDLKQTFEKQLRHYWSADLAQIYPTLKRMEASGLLTSHREPSNQGPPRKIYQRTPSGDDELQDWLKSGPEVHTDRLSWLAQVGFLETLDFDGQLQFLTELRDEFIRHREELLAIEAHWQREDPGFPDRLSTNEFFAHCTLRLGVMKYSTIVEWCEQCLTRLSARKTLKTE